jgi:hypothetical protein
MFCPPYFKGEVTVNSLFLYEKLSISRGGVLRPPALEILTFGSF